MEHGALLLILFEKSATHVGLSQACFLVLAGSSPTGYNLHMEESRQKNFKHVEIRRASPLSTAFLSQLIAELDDDTMTASTGLVYYLVKAQFKMVWPCSFELK